MFAHANAENLEKAKWIIVGVPSELGSLSNVKMYLNGPEVIRDGSYRIFDSVFGNVDMNKIMDYGDIELDDIKDLSKVYEKIYFEVKKIFRKDKRYIFLGGDHSITYPILKVIKENYDDFYLLFFDAHPDIHPDSYTNYQSFIYYAIKDNILTPERVIMVGISNLSFEEKEILREYGIRYYTPYDVWDDTNEVAKEISKVLKNKDVYMSIDLDVFEMGCAHWLEPFGIRPYHYFKIINNLDANLIGFDLVEMSEDEICGNLGAKIIIETIGIFNEQGKKGI